MSQVPASQVKKLRDKTGAGMMDCKRALQETGGDMDRAVDYLREKGLAAAAKKAERIAAEGLVDAYIHLGGRVGVLLEVNCETDFVARNDEFQEMVHDIAMQIAAMSPQYVSREDVPEAVIEEQKGFLRRQALEEGKPEHIVERIVEGRLDKFLKGICLLEQDFVKDSDITVADLVKRLIAKLGENIQVRRFVRYEVAEGLEKRADNLGDEVASMLK